MRLVVPGVIDFDFEQKPRCAACPLNELCPSAASPPAGAPSARAERELELILNRRAADVRAAAVGATPAARDEIIPFDNIRRRTAVALLASKLTIPHACAVTSGAGWISSTSKRGVGYFPV